MAFELDETPSGPGPRLVGALSPEGVPGCLDAVARTGRAWWRVFGQPGPIWWSSCRGTEGSWGWIAGV